MNSPPVTGPVVYAGGAGSETTRFQQAVSEHLGPFQIRVVGPAGPGFFRARMTSARSGGVGVATLVCDLPVQADIEVAPDGAYLVVLAQPGVVTVVVDKAPVERGPFVVSPRQRVRSRWSAGHPVTVVRVPRRLVDRVRREQGVRVSAAPALRFDIAVRDPARVQTWWALAQAFASSYESGMLSGASSAGSRFGQLLAHALLALQPHAAPAVRAADVAALTGGTDPDADPAGTLPAPLARAVAYCRRHAHEQVSVPEIADAAGLSVRRLQANFRTHLDTTPVEYVRRVRLAGVHRDLQRIADGVVEETITDAALRWGFTHLGRFSGVYREEFGVLPSQTARAPRPAAR